MKGKCKFKVTACGFTFKVVALEKSNELPMWAVMEGRAYAKRPFLYYTPEEAITRAVQLAKYKLAENNLLYYEP